MIDVVKLKEMPEGIVEPGGRVEILSCKDITSCVFPKPLDNVEVGGIRRQEYETDSKLGCLVLYCLTMLISRVVEHDGNRSIPRFPSHFFKKGLCLFRIHINHGMGLYDVERERIDTAKKVEAVSSGSDFEIKRFLAPYMAGERLQCEMDGIHEIEFAAAFFRLFYNGLQCGTPFCLPLRTHPARNGLCLYEPKSTAVHYLPCPCQAERYYADVSDYVRRLGGTPGTSDSSLLEISSMWPFRLPGRPGIGLISRTESIPLLL